MNKIVPFCLSAFLLLVGLISIFSFPSVSASGGVLTPHNPYIEVTDGGSTDNILLTGTGSSTKDGLVNVIKGVINWALGILAFVALVVLLYGGFLMVTAAGESDRYDKGFTILKQAAVGLVIIGVARFIVSIIFWLINLTAEQSGAVQGAGTES